jgi:hypothetical protein
MPFSIDIDDVNSLVLSQYWGVADNAGFLGYLEAMAAAGPFDERFRLLAVFHDDVIFEVDANTVRAGAAMPAVLPLTCKRLIVASQPLAFGLSRMYTLEASDKTEQYTVVENIADACRLLDLDVSQLKLRVPKKLGPPSPAL